MRLYVALGMMGLGGAFYVTDQINLHTNYTKVDARIIAVEFDCYVEGGRSKLVKKGSSGKAYMACSEAEIAAQAFGYKPRDIHRRVKFTYDFVSPVDKSHHNGKYERDDVDQSAYYSGKTIPVYAHKEKADSSRI